MKKGKLEKKTSGDVALDLNRAVARALIGGGGVYSYIRAMPDQFLLKSVVCFFSISKKVSRAEHEYLNTPPPPPPQLTL